MNHDEQVHRCCLCGCRQPAGAYITVLPKEASYVMCENCCESVLSQFIYPDAIEADLHVIVDRLVSVLEQRVHEREMARIEKEASSFWDSRW